MTCGKKKCNCGCSKVQAVLFKKRYWKLSSSMKWLKEHNFKPIKKMHETPEYYRYRLREPTKFKRLRTITNPKYKSVKFIIGV